MKIIDSCLKVAEELHLGQFRKDGVTPYIEHPKAVVKLLIECGITDKETLSVGYLHDVLEDCNIDIKLLADKIKANVRISMNTNMLIISIINSVKHLTFVNNGQYSKAYYLSWIATNGNDIDCVVKVADRICNVRDFIKSNNIKYAEKYFHQCDSLYY